MARRAFKTILVGIEAPHERRQLALRKAAQLAQTAGARLKLFHCAFAPRFAAPRFYRSMLEQAFKKTLAERRAALQKLAEPLRRQGLKVTVKTVWDDPAYEGIVREVLRSKPDLVVVESRRHVFGARLLLTNTDWQLIRLCPAPLLFVKQSRPYGKARVLAAVDPMHAHSKPADLDQRILEVAHALAAAHLGSVDVVHAWLSPPTYAMGVYGDGMPMSPQFDRDYERLVKGTLERTVAPFDLAPRRLHMVMGEANTVLPTLARKLRADVLVMGAVSRRGLKGLFIGNTAERTIDHSPCDVLIVKPKRFKTTVSPRPSSVQQSFPSI